MIFRHHGIPQKFVNVIQALYEKIECRVIHNNQVIEPYSEDTECQTRMHPISCALLHGSGLAHATCHPRRRFLNGSTLSQTKNIEIEHELTLWQK